MLRAWRDAEKGAVHTDLYTWAANIEMQTAYWKSRCATMYRLVNGEDPPVSFGLWLTQRAADYVGGLGNEYRRPFVNGIHEGVSFLENRIGQTRNVIEVKPNNTAFKVREACRDVTSIVETIWDTHDVFGTQRLTFRDRATFGMSVVKVAPSYWEKRVIIERALPTDIYVDPALSRPRELAQLVPMARADAKAAWGKDPEIAAAIENAPPAYVSTPYQVSDMICVLEAWALPGADGSKGRHVICLNNVDIVDEAYTVDHYPFAIRRFQPATVGWYANGAAYEAVPYQRKVNELCDRIGENQLAAFGYWIVDANAKLSEKALGARPRAVITHANGPAPTYVTPQASQPELYQDLDRWVEKLLRFGFGISSEAVGGESPKNAESGRAKRIAVGIEDSRHKALSIEGEEETKDIGKLIIEAAEAVNLRVSTSGINSREVSVSELGIKRNRFQVTVYPRSSLPSEPAGQADEIEERFQRGVIDRRTYLRLLNWGDLTTTTDYQTAFDDLTEDQLDTICRDEKFIAPEVSTADEATRALTVANARFQLEVRYKSPRKTLRALQQYRNVLADFLANPSGQFLQSAAPPAPAAPNPGTLNPNSGMAL